MVDQGRCNHNFSQSFTTAENSDTILCELIPGEAFSFFDMNRRFGIFLQNQTVSLSLETTVTSGPSLL